MLEKTFALLNDIPGGTYVPAEKKCYDDAEIEQLSQILKRLLWAPSQIRKKLQQAGVTIAPCNFYSEIPSIEEIERSFEAPGQTFDLIFDDSRMKEVLAELHRFSHEFDPPRENIGRDQPGAQKPYCLPQLLRYLFAIDPVLVAQRHSQLDEHRAFVTLGGKIVRHRLDRRERSA